MDAHCNSGCEVDQCKQTIVGPGGSTTTGFSKERGIVDEEGIKIRVSTYLVVFLCAD